MLAVRGSRGSRSCVTRLLVVRQRPNGQTALHTSQVRPRTVRALVTAATRRNCGGMASEGNASCSGRVTREAGRSDASTRHFLRHSGLRGHPADLSECCHLHYAHRLDLAEHSMGIGTRGDVLWIDCYRGHGTPRSSSSLGYGRSSADVLVTLLETLGFRVHRVGGNVTAGILDTASWRLDTFRKVAAHLRNRRPTLVFVFHAFDTPPVEIRRMMLEYDIPHTPLVGYTHGSHWDLTDTWRQEKYQGLDLYDLACLSAFDRLLVVSEYMRETLSQAITRFSPAVAASIIDRATVVGLPIDEAGLTRERQRPQSQGEEVRVLFNHAPTAAKNPEMFLRVMDRILAQRHDVTVVLTRRFGQNDPGFDHLGEISTKYEGRVRMGEDFSLSDYYSLLWQCDIQVSTALHESFGVATLEAMFAENACLLPRHAVYPELCGGIEESLYEYSEEVLSDRLLELIDAPSVRQDLARRLSQRARDVCATAKSAFTTAVLDAISQR
jgi:glycosyltransferase involved in cell wall biosynthesis